MNIQDIKRDFFEKGWCKIESFFDKSVIEEIKTALDDFMVKEVNNLKKGESHFTDKTDNNELKINTIHVLSQKSSYFNKLLRNRKINELVKTILDDDIEPQWSQLFAKPARVGLGVPMHQDNYYWNINDNKTVTAWIAIDKVTNNNSGLSYYEGSHKLGLVEHEASFAKGTSQTVATSILTKLDNDTLVTPLLEPGDILLHHSCMIHGSAPNLSDSDRRGMSMWYKAKSAGINQEALTKYQKSLKEQLDKKYK